MQRKGSSIHWVSGIGTISAIVGVSMYLAWRHKKNNDLKRSCERRKRLEELLIKFNAHPKIQEWKENVKRSNQGWSVEPVPGLLGATKELVDEIFACLGLKLVVLDKEYYKKHVNYEVKVTPAVEENVNKYLPCLVLELSLYTDTLFRKLGVDKVILCEASYINGQYRQAVPDWGSGQLIFTCKEAVQYSIEVVHHELFHYIDYKRVGKDYIKDNEWHKLNSPGFEYGTGGVNNREWKPLDSDLKGFVSFYATTALEEDKAEVWVRSVRNYSTFKTHADEILRQKTEILKKQLSGYDEFCFGKDFWENLSRRKDVIKEFFNN